jgi:hypothetical protein
VVGRTEPGTRRRRETRNVDFTGFHLDCHAVQGSLCNLGTFSEAHAGAAGGVDCAAGTNNANSHGPAGWCWANASLRGRASIPSGGYIRPRGSPRSGRNRSLVSLAVGSKPQITASIRREKPIRFFAYSRQLVPKPHRAGADEPTDPEPIGIVCHSSVDIPGSTRNLDAATFRPVWHFAAEEEALAPQFAAASSALSAPPEKVQYI